MTTKRKIPAAGRSRFPVSEARAIVGDLFRPDPRIYWVDFLSYNTLGWLSFAYAVRAQNFSVFQLTAFVVSVLSLYRAVIFIHELAHLKKNSFNVFRLVWNLTCGFPLMVPSFMYGGVHNDHHKPKMYGTKADGEYFPFAAEHPLRIVGHLFLVLILPGLFALRFLVLAPLSYLHPAFRSFVWKHVSSLAIDASYVRPSLSARDEKSWPLQEAAAFVYGVGALVLAVRGVWPAKVFVLWYGVTFGVLWLNTLRTLAAHRYRNPESRTLDLSEQFFDSVNIPGHLFVTAMWAPVGLRYHATHHLFPTMPYHSLGKAHRRLLRELRSPAVYRKATRKGLWDSLAHLWRESRAAARGSR